jgi:hypothetical protein
VLQKLKTASLIFVEGLLLFVAVNLVIAYAVPADKTAARFGPPAWEPQHQARLEKLYGLPIEAVRAIISEAWTWNSWVYEPYLEFRERPRRGRFVNVSPQGYRLNGEGRPVALRGGPGTVYLFGGSTSFGYGVRDEDTIASHLESALRMQSRPATVFNFGRCYYSSTQELLLFRSLVQRGFVPETAIFLHGVNEHLASCPQYSNNIAQMFEIAQHQPRARLQAVLWSLPVMRVLRPSRLSLLDESNFSFIQSQQSYAFECDPPPGMSPEAYRASIYRMNADLMRGIAAQRGITIRIFVQPVGGYLNAFTSDPYGRPIPDRSDRIRLVEGVTKGPEESSLAGVLRDLPGEAFVDRVHYTSGANRWIAEAMARALAPNAR